MDQRPIGVFDSGLGGLTAVHSLWRILPEEDLIYFGDTARVPYGSRSREAILKYARQDVRFLRSFDLKAILIACGTVTTTSLAALQAENDLPMVGVVEPTCRRAVLMTQNKRVGLIATAASVRSGAYEAALRRLDPEVTVFSRACPLFVPLAEAGRIRRGDVVIETVAREYLTPLKNAGSDGAELLTRGVCIVLHNGRKQNGIGNTVRCVVYGAQSVSHGMNDAKSAVRESHTG